MTSTSPSATPEAFKAALGTFASGVTVVTSRDEEGRPWGMTATAFSSVSADPATVLICVNNRTRTHELTVATGRFGVNILSASGLEISNFCANPGGDKFLADEWLHEGVWHAPALQASLSFLDCRVDQQVDAGTHSVFFGAVEHATSNELGAAGEQPEPEPLVYWRGGYRCVAELQKAAAR